MDVDLTTVIAAALSSPAGAAVAAALATRWVGKRIRRTVGEPNGAGNLTEMTESIIHTVGRLERTVDRLEQTMERHGRQLDGHGRQLDRLDEHGGTAVHELRQQVRRIDRHGAPWGDSWG